MIRVVPVTEQHARQFEPHADQADEDVESRVQLVMQQAALGPTWAVLASGEVIAIAGTVEPWKERAVGWAFLSHSSGAHMLGLTRVVRKYLNECGYRRVETYVDAQFTKGCRWAELLGFRLETPEPMPQFTPNGNSAYLYGRT